MSRIRRAMLALAAIGAASLAGGNPAAARDYPWCAQGEGYGYPGECAYETYEQCLASVSGRLLYCDVNPRVAFAPPPAPPPRHKRRVHRN